MDFRAAAYMRAVTVLLLSRKTRLEMCVRVAENVTTLSRYQPESNLNVYSIREIETLLYPAGGKERATLIYVHADF